MFIISTRASLPSTTMDFILILSNNNAPTVIYTLSLHDALPISWCRGRPPSSGAGPVGVGGWRSSPWCCCAGCRSEEHTSELQSRFELVCRLLLEKKKTQIVIHALLKCQQDNLYHEPNVIPIYTC